MATWTVVYHICLVARLGVGWALLMEALALAACGFWLVRRRRTSLAPPGHPDVGRLIWSSRTADVRLSPDRRLRLARLDRTLVILTVALAAAAAVAMAVNAPWVLVAAAWLLAAGTGTSWALLSLWVPSGDPGLGLQSSGEPGGSAPAVERRSAIVALVWAAGLAVMSLCLLRSNPDDVYYVNLSQWVTDHGTFPLRDTIFANLVYPMSSWPPMASYDALMGTVARLAHVRAAAVVYIVAPPIVTLLSVLAMWRLLRAWQVKSVSIALSSALVFLLLDGASPHAPGTLFVSRLWQAKVVFLCLMVPVLLMYAVRYVERPDRERAGWLFVGGVAAVGVSTSAMFLVPVIAAAGAAPLVLRSTRRAVAGFAAMAAYPLAASVVTKAVGGRSADDFNQKLTRFDPDWFGHEVFHDGVTALIAVSAVLLGVLLVPHPLARITTGLLAMCVGITFIPGFTHLSFDLVGLGPTLWRMTWVVTVAALVGVAATRTSERLARPALRLAGPVGLRSAAGRLQRPDLVGRDNDDVGGTVPLPATTRQPRDGRAGDQRRSSQ